MLTISISIYTLLFHLLALKSVIAFPLSSEGAKPPPKTTVPTSIKARNSFFAGGLVGSLGSIALGTSIFTSRYSDMEMQNQRQEQLHATEREKWKVQMHALQSETVSKHPHDVSPTASLSSSSSTGVQHTPEYTSSSTGVQHTPEYTSSSTETTIDFNPEGAQKEILALEERLHITVSELENAQVKSKENLELFNTKRKEYSQIIEDYNKLVHRFNALANKYDKTWF